MIEFEDNIKCMSTHNISIEYIEKAVIYTSFVLDRECHSIAFVIDDDGYIDVVPTDEGLPHTAYFMSVPYGLFGLPIGMKNLLIEDIQDFNDFKVMLFEEFPNLEFEIQDVYSALLEYTEQDEFSSSHVYDDLYGTENEGEDEL